MSVDFNTSTIGVFKNEIKNRFRSEVLIDNNVELCYIQSSSRLDNYVNLKNKKVILKKIDVPNKLKYTVLAKPYFKDYILLVPMMANEIVYNEINRRIFSSFGYRKDAILEHNVEGYKADIYLPKEDEVIEIKVLISDKKNGNVFPTVYSDRTIMQLENLKKLLLNGKKCIFIIVSFNPYYKVINILRNTDFYIKLNECLKFGMKLYSYSVSCINGIHIKKKLIINYL